MSKLVQMEEIHSVEIERPDLGANIVQTLPLDKVMLTNKSGQSMSLLDFINRMNKFYIEFQTEYVERGFNKRT